VNEWESIFLDNFLHKITVNRNEKHAIDGTNSSERFLLLEFLAVENVDFDRQIGANFYEEILLGRFFLDA
jgi:hypothetical protein